MRADRNGRGIGLRVSAAGQWMVRAHRAGVCVAGAKAGTCGRRRRAERDRVAPGDSASLSGSAAVCSRRFQFSAGGDTFAHGRLANPTPAMWTHFESIHITMQPTYQSMYFPGQGLLLAASKVDFGNPWIGLLIVSALMCAALCWMLQAWLPPSWALLGGVIAVLRLGVFSYWTNTYHAGGSLAALGGALILGGLPRLMRTARMRYAMLMGIGIAILVLTRPYEGILLCLPVGIRAGAMDVEGQEPAAPRRSGAADRGAAAVWNRRRGVDGLLRLSRLRQSAHAALHSESQYLRDCSVLYLAASAARAALPLRRDAELSMRQKGEMGFYNQIHSLKGFVPHTLEKVGFAFLFYSGFALLVPLIMVRRVFPRPPHPVFGRVCAGPGRRNGDRDLSVCRITWRHLRRRFMQSGLQAMRHLRVWKPEGRPDGVGDGAADGGDMCFAGGIAGVRAAAGHGACANGRRATGTSRGSGRSILARRGRRSRPV